MTFLIFNLILIFHCFWPSSNKNPKNLSLKILPRFLPRNSNVSWQDSASWLTIRQHCACLNIVLSLPQTIQSLALVGAKSDKIIAREACVWLNKHKAPWKILCTHDVPYTQTGITCTYNLHGVSSIQRYFISLHEAWTLNPAAVISLQ